MSTETKIFLDKESDEFGTPLPLFMELHGEFQFTVDAMASDENRKLDKYWTKEQNVYHQSTAGERVFCNPPYSRGHVDAIAKKAYADTVLKYHDEGADSASRLWVLLVPTRTEQDWFQELVLGNRYASFRPIRGRIKFQGGETSARDSHMIVIFRRPGSYT